MRIWMISCCFFLSCLAYGQNKQVLYNFAKLPQTLLLNPGAEVNYKLHVGVPLLSGISVEAGSSKFRLSDLFTETNEDFTTKFLNVYRSLSARDYIFLNAQVEIVNIGYQWNESTYLSVGFYNELDAIFYYPRGIVVFFNEGNAPTSNRNISLSEINMKADFSGVLHFGVSKKINSKLRLGGRFKIYSSTANLNSSNNKGVFTTEASTDAINSQSFSNIDVAVNSSGILKDGVILNDFGKTFSNSFLGGNIGFGVDFGVTYHYSKQMEITGSILDLGYVNQTNNNSNYTLDGNFTYNGIILDFDANNPDYWTNLEDSLRNDLPSEENSESYLVWKPTKINASIKYSFGQHPGKFCYDPRYRNFYKNAVGVQLFSVFRPINPNVALTAFYERAVSDQLYFKFTYTIDDFSYYNIGAGVSAQFGPLNAYATIGNSIEYTNLTSANNISLQLGFNLLFN